MDELRELQARTQAAWAVRGVKNRQHIGDLAWGVNEATDSVARLFDGGWGWLHGGTALDWQVDPARPEVLAEILAWAGPGVTTTALQSDAAAADVLRAQGFRVDEERPWFAYMQRSLDDLPPVELPDGFVARTVRGEEEVAARTEVHRASWEPSKMTEEKVLATMRRWPYRFDLDCVVEAPDGSFASYTLAWLDEQNRVGEFEPVGTVPAMRRRGLGRAANVFALHGLRNAGAETAIVYCRGDAAYPIPKLLYESVGFRAHDRTVTWAAPAE